MDSFFKWIGIITTFLVLFFSIIRLFFGKNWYYKIIPFYIAGSDLTETSKRLYNQVKNKKIEDETSIEFVVAVFKRLTRIGLLAIIVAIAPFYLLYIQNGLIKNQNQLFSEQNQRIDTQNDRLNLQNNLLEADRRSSLIFLMSNILDEINQEFKIQDEGEIHFNNTLKYELSDPTISRIIALSKAFKPYKILNNDTLSSNLSSPERGQFFIALSGANLSNKTLKKIYRDADFSYADIGNINLKGKYLERINLSYANLEEIDLQYSNLVGASFIGANLSNAYLSGARINGSDFSFANMTKAKILGEKAKGELRDIYFQTNKMKVPESLEHEEGFRNKSIGGARFNNSNLEQAVLVGRKISMSVFDEANLEGTNFKGSSIIASSFRNVKGLKAIQFKELEMIKGNSVIPDSIGFQLEKMAPCLFEKNGCKVVYY